MCYRSPTLHMHVCWHAAITAEGNSGSKQAMFRRKCPSPLHLPSTLLLVCRQGQPGHEHAQASHCCTRQQLDLQQLLQVAYVSADESDA